MTKKKVIEEKAITLDFICGYKEEKKAIRNIVNLLNDYEKYEKQGVNIPRGLIFQGPPGTGKTLFAKAIAGECSYKFYNAFDPENDEATIDTLKNVFKDAEKNSEKTNQPSLIYIDEIDKLAYTDHHGNLDETARECVRFLLQKLDETKLKNKILIIASTNNYRKIPHALLRSGRFDKKLLIDLPDTESREEILKLYINKHPLFKNINTHALALKTQGMSGADLKTLINNTLLEYVTNKKKVDLNDFIKIIHEMNFETIGKKWNNDENALEVLAHEIGHALVSYELTGSCGTVSALRYGNMAGSTDLSDDYDDEEIELPDDYDSERRLRNYNDIVNDIMITLGGKVGEKVYLNQISTGVGGDMDAIYSDFSIMNENCCLGFKYSRAFTPNSTEDYHKRNWRKHYHLVKKYYRRATRIVKKNKALGLYLIEEIHKHDDVLSNGELLKRIKKFKSSKDLQVKYKKIKFNELAKNIDK